MTIKAIETRYKGYRFRSRLEARWAVFFDKMGWEWRYEHEGYVIGHGDEAIAWLPDFEIITPIGQHFYVEVKGDPDFFSKNNMWLDKLDFYGGPPGFANSAYDLNVGPNVKPLILLGDIPDVPYDAAALLVCVIAHHKGVGAFFVSLYSYGIDAEDFSRNKWRQVDGGVGLKDFQAEVFRVLPKPGYKPVISNALRAARSARFEHGENGNRSA